jgi:hypothetical protein
MATQTHSPKAKAKTFDWQDAISTPHGWSEKIILGAAILGFIACFLPAATISILGINASENVIADWRGKLGFVGYIAIGIMAFQCMQLAKKPMAPSRKKILWMVILSGICALLSIWLLLSLTGLGEGFSKGIGLFVNILASLVVLGASLMKARQEKLF